MRKKCLPHFYYLNVSACCVTNPSRALAPQQTLFGLSVTEAVLSAAQTDTLHPLASGFAQSQSCGRSSQHSVAGRHLHHMRFERHGRGCLHAEGYHPCRPTCLCIYECVHNLNHRASLVNHAISAYMWVVRGFSVV